ncbi:MAG: hypothetical protein CSB44_08730 [Gammaproteobacteria bacterium]|nr:MAG: hypothetical protein CSB44_08730 [Gammaproteobacteria bacterium]
MKLTTHSIILFTAALLVVGNVQATTFGVRVVNQQGEPIAGAAVCVGMEGNYRQFGATFTDDDGEAVMDVPNVPLVVTVSKTRFSAMRIKEPARGFNLIKEVTLHEGQPGPRCKADSAYADAEPGEVNISISNIDIVESAEGAVLRPEVSGNPSHYRIASTPEFADAGWRRYDRSITVPRSMSRDEKPIYLQMRRFEGGSTGWLEARSNIVTVRLTQ